MKRHSRIPYIVENHEQTRNRSISPKPQHSATFNNPTPLVLLHQSKFPFILTIACAIPCILFINAFSAIGNGRENMLLSREYDKYSSYLIGSMISFGGILNLFDISYWESIIGKAVRETFYAMLVICGVIIVFLQQDTHPTGPLCAFIICMSLWLLGIKFLFCDQTQISGYVGWLSAPLFLTSIATIGTWIYWVFFHGGNEWDNKTKLEYSVDLGCKPNFSSLPECMNMTLYNSTGELGTCFRFDFESTDELIYDEDCNKYCLLVYNKCVHAFLLWANPALAGIALFMLSFICKFLNRKFGLTDWKIILVVKVYTLLLFAMWCAASLAGAGEGLSKSFFSFALASFAAIGILTFPMTTAFHSDEEQARMKEVFLATHAPYIDVFRSLLVITCAPAVCFYFLWSALNQFIRRKSFPCSKRTTTQNILKYDNWKNLITEEALNLIEEFESWDHSKIYRYSFYWGLIYMSLEVIVQKFTVSFLSRLIASSENLPLPSATIIIIAAGMFLFLFPPVPGGPIYCCAGIILLSSGRKTFGIVGSIIYACGISLFLKISACAIQQKVIGENLSKSVRVRQLVKINSRIVQAVKLILSERGMSIPKMSILVGGPDWPTSVLCGILRMEVIPVLLGTLPIIIIIIPMVLTGAFTYLASLPPQNGTEQFPWAGTVCAAVAVITSGLQFGSMALAAHFVEKTISSRGTEIDEMHIDLQVLQADEQVESINSAYNKVQKWNALPYSIQWCLKLSLMLMITCCYSVSFLSSWCFSEFNFLDSTPFNQQGLLFGFIKPFGIAVLSLFLFSCLLFVKYLIWANGKANELLQITKCNFKTEGAYDFNDKNEIYSESSPLNPFTADAQYGAIFS